jgi:hypothetical protein
METFDHDPNLFTRPHAGDDSLFVVFYMGVLKNEAKSIEAGRPIFDDVECLRIIVPGDRNNIVDRPATMQDKQRFAKQYAMFKEGHKEEDQITGTRLTEWPFLTRGQCEEFRYLGLRTVEQLAEVRDDICSKVPGLTVLKRNAAMWLDKSKGAAESAKVAKQLDEQTKRIQHLEDVIRDQAARLEKAANKA